MTNDFNGLGILVLDTAAPSDTPGIGAYLHGCLRELGIRQVFDASATDQAVAVLADSRVDGVFVNCPAADVVATSRALRAATTKQPAGPRLILVAGAADRAAVRRAFEVGVQDFLATPITKDALAARLHDLPRPS